MTVFSWIEQQRATIIRYLLFKKSDNDSIIVLSNSIHIIIMRVSLYSTDKRTNSN